MRAVIIGLGVIGNVHLKVLLSQGVQIAALCDVNEAAANAAAAKCETAPIIYTDYLVMLEQVRPDVVHICTPHHLHAQMVIACLRRNIHVLCEKPLCIHSEELTEIIEAEKRTNATLGVCHQNRYTPVNLFIKDYLQTQTIASAHASVVWRRDEDYYNSAAWRGKQATEGGGVLINQALHTLDLLQWFVGMPEQLTARIDRIALQEKIEVEDSAVIRAEGDVPFTFFATIGGFSDYPAQLSLSLSDGRVLTILPRSILLDGEVIFADEVRAYHEKLCYGNGHDALIADFYNCVAKGLAFPIGAREAGKVIHLILASYASRGETVSLNEKR